MVSRCGEVRRGGSAVSNGRRGDPTLVQNSDDLVEDAELGMKRKREPQELQKRNPLAVMLIQSQSV